MGEQQNAAHWRIFNILTRLMGIMGLLGGIAFGGTAIHYALDPEAAKGIVTISEKAYPDFAVASIFGLVIGVLVLRARPHRPDLNVNGRTETAQKDYYWWTGDPVE